jgi:hypothetical protein
MPFEDPSLWAARTEWPHAPLNFVFLLEAVVFVARRMLGSDWSSQFVPADDPEQFEKVITAIAQACEAEELTAWYRRPPGELARMEPADWQWTSSEIPRAWQIFFHSGQLLENDLEGAAETCTVPSEAPRPLNVCWIFLRRGELDRFIRSLRHKKAQGAVPYEQVHDWAEAYVQALQKTGQNPNQKKMWTAAKDQLPGAKYKQVMDAKEALTGPVGPGRIKSKNQIQK